MSDLLTEQVCPCCGLPCVPDTVSGKTGTDSAVVEKVRSASKDICTRETGKQVSDDGLQSCVETLQLTCISEPIKSAVPMTSVSSIKSTAPIESELPSREIRKHNLDNANENNSDSISDPQETLNEIKLATVRIGTLRNRSQLGRLATLLNLQTGVEVGTQMGVFAKELLTEWTTCKEFHIVDLWKHQDNYSNGANVSDSQHDACFQKAMLNLRPWLCRNMLRIHGELSCEAAKKIPPIDIVYIDARHDYKGVMEDLTAYWPLLNIGGIMAGHDFLDADQHKKYNPSDDWTIQYDGTKRSDNKAVKSAVLEFFGKKNLIVYVTRDGPWCSWFVFKQQQQQYN